MAGARILCFLIIATLGCIVVNGFAAMHWTTRAEIRAAQTRSSATRSLADTPGLPDGESAYKIVAAMAEEGPLTNTSYARNGAISARNASGR